MTVAPLAVAAALALAEAAPPRDHQWLYREQQGDGQPLPHAIFLSWDFARVIFHGACSRERPDTLELRYFPDPQIGTRNADGHLALDPVPPIVLRRGERELVMETGLIYDSIVGRARITPELLTLLRPADETGLGIDAVSEMGEEWDAGTAEPLYRLAMACDDPER
ncbi:MAG TPA: hypothetical protein VLK25_07330 [Allosphingosinicella sp.]|nr:hypothetical protein [Allosphingosinicella sp.]